LLLLVFTWFYLTIFISSHEFYFLAILLLIPLRGKGRGEPVTVWYWLLAAGLNHDSANE